MASDLTYLERTHIDRLNALLSASPRRYIAASMRPAGSGGSLYAARIVLESDVEYEAFGADLLEALGRLSELTRCVIEEGEVERMLGVTSDLPTQEGDE